MTKLTKKEKRQEMEHIITEIKEINKELKKVDPKLKPIHTTRKRKITKRISWEQIFKWFRRLVMIFLSLTILLVWLDLIKTSIVNWINLDFLQWFFNSPIKSFFISYLMTEITMSWSPIAGAFISLWDILSINQWNLTGIIMGTRWWVNSFLLISGILMLFKGKSLKRALWITIIQFLVTLSTTIIAGFLVFSILKITILTERATSLSWWFAVNSFFDLIVKFCSEPIMKTITNPIITGILGLFGLILGLFLFDRSFSFLAHWKDRKFIHKIVCVRTSFLAGFIITSLTMSMSISVAILLPLYIRKVINRKMLIAYVLWANISTLFDTLFLWIISESILWIKVILGFMIAVTIAVSILMISFRPFQHLISHLTDKILKNKYTFIIFTAIVMFLPIIFLFI